MPKPTIDPGLLSKAWAMNRAPLSLGPGVVRVAADEESAEVYVYGDIGGRWDGIAADEFAKEVGGLTADTINVRLNSLGGVVCDGVAIYNALAHHSSKIVVHIDGIAASIASVIAMAGDEIRISEGAHVMVHKPWSLMVGDADAMRKEGDILDKLEAGIVDIYEPRTGATRADLEAWVAEETWFKGQEAIDAGFADVLVPARKKAKASAHARSAILPMLRKAPKDLLPVIDRDPAVRDLEALFREGEGLSWAQAKRFAANALRIIGSHRDDVGIQPEALRDEGGAAVAVAELERLAAHLRNLI